MKYLAFILLTLSLFSTRSLANTEEINPDTARAYEGYLLTFLWPDNQTTEFIEYENVLSLDGLTRIIENTEQETLESENIEQTLSAFEEGLKTQIGKRIPILVSQKWTLIFKHAGDKIYKEFHSEQIKDGYPELTGKIAIKLGRYLESDISYQHYLFDSFTQPIPEVLIDDQEPAELKAFEPALVLTLNQSNKTASKKLNYLDHPTIGTLLYFEPIELEEAMATLTSQSNPPETGEGLNYNNLQSTNELLN
ncbi:hypothetical protein OFY17_04800 [Marinomonas sp. C2222]|uniref:Uncharacterized protein n=1 Tax=Marinomonas sargassi TaxID=2984494 RepID=A0ABT2YQM7_9GAMM|nr:hypothetical protein [Marinomonas sargassi]MCV2402202.1 hypothetical protein [Marinomonas sargassi]